MKAQNPQEKNLCIAAFHPATFGKKGKDLFDNLKLSSPLRIVMQKSHSEAVRPKNLPESAATFFVRCFASLSMTFQRSGKSQTGCEGKTWVTELF